MACMNVMLMEPDTIQGWRQRREEDPCGTCGIRSPLGGMVCELAPDHQTAHRARAWSWDNPTTGAKAVDEGRTW